MSMVNIYVELRVMKESGRKLGQGLGMKYWKYFSLMQKYKKVFDVRQGFRFRDGSIVLE